MLCLALLSYRCVVVIHEARTHDVTTVKGNERRTRLYGDLTNIRVIQPKANVSVDENGTKLKTNTKLKSNNTFS